MAERDLVVRIIGDEKDLVRALNRSEREAKSFQGTITGVGAATSKNFLKAGVAAGAAAVSFQTVTAAIGEAVTDATNLSEQLNKSREVFGDSAQEVENWSRTTARSFGISQQAALEATGTFGNLFATVDLAPAAAADMSRALVELTADLASFNNASPEDVLLAIRSGLVGEAEPLRRYGVLLSEARVQQRALADTGKRNVKALTDQEKAIARYEIIMSDTATAQGDFARTSDGLANQTRILHAQMDDLSANLGGVLIPALTSVTTAANNAFEAFERLGNVDATPGFDLPDAPGWLKDIGGKAAGLAAVGWISPAAAVAAAINMALDDEAKEQDDLLDKLHGARTRPNKIDAALRVREREAKQTAANLRRSKTAFATFVKGMGLKLDKAQLTATFSDDLAALAELERAILRQIRVEGKTFDLVQRLVDVRLARSAIMEQRASAAATAVSDAWANTLGFLELDLDQAIEAANFKDQLAAVAAIENAILAQIGKEGKTLELMQDLFQIRKQRADLIADEKDKQRRKREERADRRKGDLFEQLGLTREGDRPTPSAKALLGRVGTLRDQLKGTIFDTAKTRRELARIAKVLTDNMGNLERDVRQGIVDMLDGIAGELDDTGKNVQISKFEKRGVEQILAGLGLTADQIKAIRGRMATVGASGLATAGTGAGPGKIPIPHGAAVGQGNIIVRGNLIVQNPRDTDEIVKQVQRKAGRSAPSRRGTRPGANRGLN